MEKKKLTLKEIGIEKLIIIFLTGVFLIVLSFPGLLPVSSSKKTKDTPLTSGNVSLTDNPLYAEIEDDADIYTKALESKLKVTLKKVDGIGDVEVMITLKSSKELQTLKDSPYTQSTMNETDGEGGSRISSDVNKQESTVFYTTEDGNSSPYIVKEIAPQIEGVVVIAEGGGSQIMKREITEAVEVLFDIPVHKIKVMKMNH